MTKLILIILLLVSFAALAQNRPRTNGATFSGGPEGRLDKLDYDMRVMMIKQNEALIKKAGTDFARKCMGEEFGKISIENSYDFYRFISTEKSLKETLADLLEEARNNKFYTCSEVSDPKAKIAECLKSIPQKLVSELQVVAEDPEFPNYLKVEFDLTDYESAVIITKFKSLKKK